MAWSFGDGFDLYAAAADAINGYWDSGPSVGSITLLAGRFSGSQAIRLGGSAVIHLVKSSGSNDAVHHLVVAFQQATALSSTVLCGYLQLLDGTTGQCCIAFRSDGAIVLTSGTVGGTVLATYTGAVTAINTWYAFEFEVVINNTTGSFSVRKNGNTSNDFSATGLNTRPGTNNYANKLQVGINSSGFNQNIDDLFWRSDASSVAWMGDVRCTTRMPASDQSVQFSRTPTSNTQTPFAQSTTVGITAGTAKYTPFTAAYDGTIGAGSLSLGTGYTGNMKCSIFASSGSAPTTVLGSATTVTNPSSGANALTFSTPVSVTKGTQYWIGFDSDTTSGLWNVATAATGAQSTTSYASFPAASPGTSSTSAPVCSLTIGITSNATVVNEAQQDGATSYVFDSNPGDADFYTIGSIASTPVTTFAVTTRGYMQKSDAGTRTAAVQLKSGGTTVASPTLVLTTSGFLWAWRMDLTDPATGAAWTAAGVNNAQIGPTTIA